jgi:hypothetical protein
MSNEINELGSEDFKSKLEQEAKILAEKEEKLFTSTSTETITSLGKAEKFKEYDEPHLAAEVGWKNVPLENLPSQGFFYDAGTQMTIRAATVAEIRHWSTIDENDFLGIDDMLNFIIEKCCRIKVPGKPASHKDVIEIDRFYLIFAIRDLTFKNGENRMFINASGQDGVDEKVEVTKDVIDYFNPDERLMKYYSTDNRCFKIHMKTGEEFNIYLPTLGTVQFIKSYLNTRRQSGQNFDKAFTKYASFLFPDWKSLNQSTYEKAVQDSFQWSVLKISIMDKLVELLSSSIKPQVRYINSGGQEATAPLSFPGGFKSLFLISDIFGELV